MLETGRISETELLAEAVWEVKVSHNQAQHRSAKTAAGVLTAVMIFGKERYYALVLLLEKYCQDFIEEGKQYIEAKDKVTRVFKIEVSHISGKARR